MTIIALILTPIVLLYQGWTYHVFRQRLGVGQAQPGANGPAAPAAPAEPTV